MSLCFISQSSRDFRITQDNNSRICQFAAMMDESIGKSPNDSEMNQRDTPLNTILSQFLTWKLLCICGLLLIGQLFKTLMTIISLIPVISSWKVGEKNVFTCCLPKVWNIWDELSHSLAYAKKQLMLSLCPLYVVSLCEQRWKEFLIWSKFIDQFDSTVPDFGRASKNSFLTTSHWHFQ